MGDRRKVEELKGRLPATHKWFSKCAERNGKRGRTSGDIIIGKNKNGGKKNGR